MVPLREVEITLSANFISQLLVGVGSGLIITNLVGGSVTLVAAAGLYVQFVFRKFKNWRSRRFPLRVIDQDTTSAGSIDDYVIGHWGNNEESEGSKTANK